MQRDLTASEQKVVGFLRSYYNLIDMRRLTGSLFMSGNALELLEKLKIATTLKVEWDKKEKLYSVTFTLTELKRYIDYCCNGLAMTIGIDGTVTTFDNFKVNLFKNLT